MSRRKNTDGLHQRKDGRWERKEKINGKMRWFDDPDPAKVWEKRDAALAESKEEQEKQDAGPTFNEVADVYKEKVLHKKIGTQRSYLPAIARARKAFGDKHMREIEPYMIAELLQSMQTSAHTTVSNQKTVINAIFRVWIDSPKWHGDKNPSAMTTIPHGLKRGKRKPPTEAQVQVVKDHYMDPDALPAVVYLCTGERRGEACGIQLKDIDFDKDIIHIRNAVQNVHNRPKVTTTKTEAGIRDIPLMQMLKKALEPLRSLPPKTYILSGTDTPLKNSEYESRWASFWHKHGFAHQVERHGHYMCKGKQKERTYYIWAADLCGHQFRHEYVCMLAEADIPEAIAIQIVGHANVKMIHEVYMSLKPKMIDDTRDKLNALMKPKSDNK